MITNKSDTAMINYLKTELIGKSKEIEILDLELHQTREKLHEAVKALNKLAILQSSGLNYTQDFTENLKMIVEETLYKINKI